MTTRSTDEPTVRLYQVHLLRWDLPLMVAATSLNHAMKLAMNHWRALCQGMVVVDATEHFESISERVRAHTDEMRFAELHGVVEFDLERGWVLVGTPTSEPRAGR